MRLRRICVVTGSRADYGYLYWPLRRLTDEPTFETTLVATGQHLSAAHGMTVEAIEADGFAVRHRIPSLREHDRPVDTALSIAVGLAGFAKLLSDMGPDLVLLVGDRFEILAPAVAATIFNIPIAHLAGGDVTEGAYDDAIRHSISKMAYLHFPTNEAAGRRLIWMGEAPERVHVIGSTGLDVLRNAKLLDRDTLFARLGGIPPRPRLLAVTFHPQTAGVPSDQVDAFHKLQVDALIGALDGMGEDVNCVFTGVNSDTAASVVARRVTAAMRSRKNWYLFESLGQVRYLSLLKHADAVVGNSSSGLYEAPWFGTPTVNIGDRQKGRLRAETVIDCPADSTRISKAIEDALRRGKGPPSSPYGDGRSSERLVAILKETDWRTGMTRKTFYHAKPLSNA